MIASNEPSLFIIYLAMYDNFYINSSIDRAFLSLKAYLLGVTRGVLYSRNFDSFYNCDDTIFFFFFFFFYLILNYFWTLTVSSSALMSAETTSSGDLSSLESVCQQEGKSLPDSGSYDQFQQLYTGNPGEKTSIIIWYYFF